MSLHAGFFLPWLLSLVRINSADTFNHRQCIVPKLTEATFSLDIVPVASLSNRQCCDPETKVSKLGCTVQHSSSQV